ncbi:uncharacterized protein N7459_008707 [Penicillium hispanicum]|uniref:uncharacterized protein n=1 Tax=Penicillium hispanicum TaxID=1080232 RepID=UPI0025404848|nr:uncharacterized protein N7459_008707 [Penicillium hispanicum]KAJ5574280.1 hypothetical protein N7459_008707 [Penicillium hispanicum]
MSSPAPSPNTLSPTNLGVLSPIVTDGTVKRSSSAKDRLSTYSNVSFTSQNRSRPGSHVFPVFHTSLPYALVRDFAYPPIHPLHYGPPPPASGVSTPASEYRRLSDPPTSWDTIRGSWAAAPWSAENSSGNQQLPAMSFGDGPPYSEDEDLHSPVVTLTRQRKKSTGADLNSIADEHMADAVNSDRGTFVGLNPDGSETYYVNGGDTVEDGPGGDYITYPANEGRPSYYGTQQSYVPDTGFESEEETTGGDRYSHDYQFAVGCPDEEMHGKAVALFDFVREHENELPLTEGQVIYVSYRHGQGWLVAEDPKTGENGLVPEEFVRLLRDIEGGLTSLNGEPNPDSTETNASINMTEDDQISTPIKDDHKGTNGNAPVTISVEGAEENMNTNAGGNRSSTMTKT